MLDAKAALAVVSEGTFAVLKGVHNLINTKRGPDRMYEECLLSALALNLKLMVKVVERLINTTLSMNLEELIEILRKISGIANYCIA